MERRGSQRSHPKMVMIMMDRKQARRRLKSEELQMLRLFCLYFVNVKTYFVQPKSYFISGSVIIIYSGTSLIWLSVGGHGC
jgi:hypothetical protein